MIEFLTWNNRIVYTIETWQKVVFVIAVSLVAVWIIERISTFIEWILKHIQREENQNGRDI